MKNRGVAVLFALSLLVGVGSPAWAGTIRHDVPDFVYRWLGRAHESVGYVDGGNIAGSGVLIGREWVVTAGHVLDGATTNPRVTFNGRRYYDAIEYCTPDEWTGSLINGYDVGLIRLSRPVKGVRPVSRYRGDDELGQVVTMAGYGWTGTGLTGAVKYDRKKRAGTNTVGELQLLGDDIFLLADFDNPLEPLDSTWGSAEPLPLEFLPSFGDSGGGLFVGGELAGVISMGLAWDDTLNSDYGDLVGCTRLSVPEINGWIDEITGLGEEPSGPGSDPGCPGWSERWPRGWSRWWPRWRNETDARPDAAPDGTSLSDLLQYATVTPLSVQIPEPATLGLLALGGLAILRRKRR